MKVARKFGTSRPRSGLEVTACALLLTSTKHTQSSSQPSGIQRVAAGVRIIVIVIAITIIIQAALTLTRANNDRKE